MRWLSAILVLGITACSSDGPDERIPPADVLSKDSMAFYLSEVHIIDAAMRNREVRRKSLQSYAKRGFVYYFDTAGVSHEKFVRSLDFWRQDTKEMAAIYDVAMERLSVKLAAAKQNESASLKNAASNSIIDPDEIEEKLQDKKYKDENSLVKKKN